MQADYARNYTQQQRRSASQSGQTFTYSGLGRNTAQSTAAKTASASASSAGGTSGGSYADFIAGIYAQQQALRDAAAQAAADAQRSAYNAQLNTLKQQAQQSLRDNYVTMKQDERRMAQSLSAQGLSGGAGESTAAALYNGYLKGQNGVQQSLQENTAALQQTLLGNLAAIEQQRLTGQASDLSSYASALKNTYTGSSAVKSSGTSAASSATTAWQKLYRRALASGLSESDAAAYAEQYA